MRIEALYDAKAKLWCYTVPQYRSYGPGGPYKVVGNIPRTPVSIIPPKMFNYLFVFPSVLKL